MKRLIEFNDTNYGTSALNLTDEQSQALQQDICVIAVTTNRARTIILPQYSALINISTQFLIVDESGGAATHNVTVQTYGSPDKINGADSVQLDLANGSIFIQGGSLPSRNSQWVALYGGGGSNSGAAGIASQAWTIAASCDNVTHETTFTITANKTITHPISFFIVLDQTNVTTGFFGARALDSIASGDVLTYVYTSPVASPYTFRLFDSLGNWSNEITAYECHA